jgi:hypothetical protein
MTQGHEPGSGSIRVSRNAGRLQEVMEGIDNRKVAQRPSPPRHTQVIIVKKQVAPFGQVTVKPRSRRGMQGDQAALSERRFTNHQPIARHVFAPQRECLRDP